MSPKAAIFDFDGTLVESVGIKDRAFHSLFAADYPAQIDAIMAYHRANNAKVRFDKFRHITETILGERYTEARAADLAQRFNAFVFDAIVACEAVPGLDPLLDELSPRLPLYLVSTSPDDELLAILSARKLAARMRGIYGASWRKTDAFRDILRREGIAASDAIMVGDTPEDRASAEAVGIVFIGRDSGYPLGSCIPIHRDLHGVLRDIRERLSVAA